MKNTIKREQRQARLGLPNVSILRNPGAKKITYFISLILLMFVASCEVDNYDLPEETLTGKLTDAENNSFITEQPNGFKIRIIENGSPLPRDFWGKPDGTFMNSKIFKGRYKIIPIDGAFFPVDTVETEISGVTTVNFEIIPFLTIEASIVQNGSNLKATYTIKKAPGAGKIQSARLLVNKWNPNVGMNYSDKNVVRNLSGVPDATIGQTEYTDEITGYLEKGVTYYARVADLATNALGRYNFSEVKEIVVP
ncbi:MAG: DUF3823 domain-containing protein [Prolixibacteraceae bacterium]